jgi:tetratricopeptide (TPR) repeat protein
LGLLTYLLIFIALFYVLWKAYKRNDIGFWAFAVFASLQIAYFVQNLTVFDMISTYFLWFLVLAFVGSIYRKEEVQEKENKKPNILLLILVIVLFGTSFFFSILQPTRKGINTIKAVSKNPFSEEKLSYYQKSVSFSPLGQDQIREFFADSTLKFSKHENISKVPVENVINEFEFVTKEIEKSLERNPLNYRLTLKLGKIYNAYFPFDDSKVHLAEKYLEKAIELSPNNQQGYWSLAQSKLFQKKVDEALKLAEKAVALEPNALRSHLVLIQVAKYTQDIKIVEEKIKNALEINLDWQDNITEVLGGTSTK